jgi:MFS family permease
MSHLAAARRHLGMSVRVIRAVLRNPALRRVQLAFLLFNAAEYGTWVAILLYAYSTLGPASVGLVALAQLAPAAAFAPVSASLADRFPRQRVLLAGYILLSAGLGMTAAGMLLDASPVIVILTAAAASVALTFTRPTQGALLPRLSRTPEELTAANGVSGTVEGAGVLLGPLAAAGLLAIGTPGLVFAAGSAASLVAAISVAGLPVPRGETSRPTTGGQSDDMSQLARRSPISVMVGGLRALASNRDTGLVVLLLGLRMLTAGAVDVLLVLLALEVFDTGESGAGILNAALGLGTVVGGAVSFALVGRQRLAPALAVSAVAWGLALVVMGTITPALLAPVVIAVGGVGLAACDVAGRTILQRVTDDRTLARVLGALEGVGLTGLAIGSLLVPVLAGAWGPEITIIAVGAMLPVGVAIAWVGLQAIDRRVRVPVRELALLRDSELLAPLAPPELEAVAGRTRWMTAERGDVLIREGEPGDRYYVLETGALLVTQQGRHLNRLDARGTGLGEIALLRDVPRTATVRADAPSVLLVLERVDFLEAVTGHDQAHDLAERVATTREQVKPTAD